MGLKLNGKVVLFIALLFLSVFSCYLYLTVGQKNWDNSLVMLSQQFLNRKISIPVSNYLPIGDIADYKYNFYLYFGPFASIFLMPFTAVFGRSTPQYLIGIFSMIFSFFAIYSISKRFKFNRIDSLWLSLFYVFSTVVFSSSVMNISAYQVQSLGASILLLALSEYFGSKRTFLIGVLLALATMTRFVFVFSVVFFFVEFLVKRLTLKQFSLIILPVIFSCILLGLYNQRRFHSFFETGYNYNISIKAFPLSENRNHGAVSIGHIPANLYSFLVMPPEPLRENKEGFFLKFPYLTVNPWGMAIWYTSPLFLFLLFKFRKSKYTLSALLASIVLMVPSFTYYGIGFVQFGYRYALDFLPFLFLLLIPSFSQKLSQVAIILITIGILFNLIYADSLFGIYPLLNLF